MIIVWLCALCVGYLTLAVAIKVYEEALIYQSQDKKVMQTGSIYARFVHQTKGSQRKCQGSCRLKG